MRIDLWVHSEARPLPIEETGRLQPRGLSDNKYIEYWTKLNKAYFYYCIHSILSIPTYQRFPPAYRNGVPLHSPTGWSRAPPDIALT